MLTRIVRRLARLAFDRRAVLKWFVPIRGPVLLKLSDFRMYVRLDDWAIGARIALKRRYEPHVTAVMRPLLRPGMVMVDIGANVGYYTLMAASRVGPTGKVIAFEPLDDNCALLSMSLKVNRFQNVTVHPLAVADFEGLVEFVIDDSNGGINIGDPPAGASLVQAVTLDAFLADERRVDIVKMDIEGAEGRALKGMRALLRRHRPLLFSEFTPSALPWRSAIEPEDYLDELRALGYRLFVIDRAQGASPVAQSNAEIISDFTASRLDHLDLLARPV